MKSARQLTLILAVLLTFSACSQHVFYPNQRQWQSTPQDFAHNYSDHYLKATDGEILQAWQLHTNKQDKYGAILYFHGNSQNISHHIEQITWLVDAGYDVVMAEYRGFGASGGEISLKQSMDDITLYLQWFLKSYPQQNKWLLGQSLGASLTLFVSGTNAPLAHQFNGIIADSGFANFRRIGQDVFAHYWFTWPVQLPLSWLMPKGFDADKVINQISPTPLLIMHSKEDRVVAFYHAEKLYKKARQPKYMLEYSGSHIQGFQQENIRQAVLDFLQNSQKYPRHSLN